MVHDHLHFHLVAAVHPGGKRSLLHPVVHFAEQYLPVSGRCRILLVEGLHSFETLSHQSDIQGVPDLLTAALVSLGELRTRHTSFIEVKGLPKESFPHLENDGTGAISLIVCFSVHLVPLVEVLLQVSLFHDVRATVER